MAAAWRALTLLCIVGFIFLSVIPSTTCSKTVFYIYGSASCFSCKAFSDELKNAFGAEVVVFKEIGESAENLEAMISIYQAAFPEVEKSEMIIPLTVILIDDQVKAVIAGEASIQFIEEVMKSEQGLTLVYPNGKIVKTNNEKLAEKIRSILGGCSVEHRYSAIHQVLIPILGAAAADSVNPCTFSVFTALLLMSMFFRGRTGMIKAGSAFVLAIYLAYYLLGLGIVRIFMTFLWLRYLIAGAGIILGSYEVFTSLRGEFKSPLPRPLYKLTSNLIDRVSQKSTAPIAFAIGFVVSFTLLPCSAGPYLVALSLIAGLSSLERFIALAIYNAVFVVPLIIILASIILTAKTAGKIKRFRSKRIHLLNLISASLLIAVCIWTLLQ